MTAAGSANGSYSYHLVISGNYADGAFAVSGETYTETGSYSSTRTDSYESSSSITQTDATGYGNYALSWSAAPDAYGQMIYTSYSYSATDAAHLHTHAAASGGGTSDDTYDTSTTVSVTGGGTTANYAGSTSWHESHQTSGGSPSEYGWTVPESGTVDLSPLDEPTYFGEWKAGSPEATNFTFHGVGQRNGTLVESATWTDHGLDVNSFASTFHDSDTGHVIDDEPDGTHENYHRDETYTAATDALGSGSYVANVASANYDVTEPASLAAHNVLTVTNDSSSGTDEDGDPYNLTYNYTGDRTSNGSYTNAFHYHDQNDGAVLLGSTYSNSTSSTLAYHAWGVRNGEAFDDTDGASESAAKSLSLGGTGQAISSELLAGVQPFTGTPASDARLSYVGNPLLAFPQIGQQLGKLGQKAIIKGPKAYYNYRIKQIGEDAKLKVGKMAVHQETMQVITAGDPTDPNKKHATGTYLLSGPAAPGQVSSSHAFAQAVGKGKDLDVAENDAIASVGPKGRNWTGVKVSVSVECTYYVQPRPAPGANRSGRCVVEYRILVDVSGTKGAVARSERFRILTGSVWFIDDNLKTTTLFEDP